MNGIAICIEWIRIGRDGMDNCCFLYMYSCVASDFEMQDNLETTGFLLSPVSVFKRHVGWIYAVRFCALPNKAELPQSSHWLVTSLCSLANQWIWAYFFPIDCKHDEQPWEIIGLWVFPNIFRLNSQSVAVLVHWKRQNVPWQRWNWGRRGDQNPELAGDSHFLSGFLVILRWIIIRNSAKACFSMFFSSFCSSIFFFSLVFQK